jgi:hypothetical protein
MGSEKQYRFTPEGMTRIIYAGVALGGAALGLGLGHAADSIYTQSEMNKYQDKQAEIAGLRDDLEETNYSFERIMTDIPEGCRDKLVEYIPGGELAITGQDGVQITNDSAAVNDAMANPAQLCGDDSTEIRKMVVRLGDKTLEGFAIQRYIDFVQAEADNLASVETYGQQTGAAIGALLAFFGFGLTYDFKNAVGYGNGVKNHILASREKARKEGRSL